MTARREMICGSLLALGVRPGAGAAKRSTFRGVTIESGSPNRHAGALWVVFHEGTLCDYTPNLKELAQTVPDGRSVRRLENLARRLGCYLTYARSPLVIPLVIAR